MLRWYQNAAHLTKVLWKKSQKFGAGITYSRDRKKSIAVVRYTSQGNDVHAFAQNILPAKC